MPATWKTRPEKESLHIISLTQLWENKSARALQTIRKVGCLLKLSIIDDVPKYRGIPVSRYLYYRRAFPNTAHPYTGSRTDHSNDIFLLRSWTLAYDLDLRYCQGEPVSHLLQTLSSRHRSERLLHLDHENKSSTSRSINLFDDRIANKRHIKVPGRYGGPEGHYLLVMCNYRNVSIGAAPAEFVCYDTIDTIRYI